MRSRRASCAISAMRCSSTTRLDPEPFWNRVEGARWPSEAAAFDRRLAEVGILFASIGRQPHIWVAPPHDEPRGSRRAAGGQRVRGHGQGIAHGRARRYAGAGRPGGAAGCRRGPGAARGRQRRRRRGRRRRHRLGVARRVRRRRGEARSDGRGDPASLADRRFMHYVVRQAAYRSRSLGARRSTA